MPAPPPEVFISYSSKDKTYKEDLRKQLEILAQQGVIHTWHDGLLVPGQQWNEEIIRHLKSSRVILLLISPDFLNSGYVNNVELKLAAERYTAGELCVISVLVRNTYGWKGHAFGSLKLGNLQAVPAGEKFIKDWKNKDGAYAEVTKEIHRAVEQLKAADVAADSLLPAMLPPPPDVDFVSRKGRDGRDIIERLKEDLSPANPRLLALVGDGGVGKTTLAAEAVRALVNIFAGRIVWASAEKRADFTFSTLLDEIAAQLGDRELSRLALEPKEEAVRALLAAAPTLIVLDNFETVSNDEQRTFCTKFLASAGCPALITTRLNISGARPAYVDSMKPAEAQEFLDKLMGQMQDPSVFTEEVVRRIIKEADARPYVMQWVAAQIDLRAQEPDVILEELSHGRGDAAERVFDRSYNLPQLGDDGRAALLALSLFVPSATREALAAAAGFENDLDRVNDAITSLRSLLLLKGKKGNKRLAIEGLTRSLANARLKEDPRSSEFRQRFVGHFLSYAQSHAQPTPEDFDALELEKDNVISAMDVAFNLSDWSSVMQLMSAINLDGVNGFLGIRGYWDKAISKGKLGLEAARIANSEWHIGAFANGLGAMLSNRGDYSPAKEYYELAVEIARRLDIKQGLSATLHELGRLAQAQGELSEARRLYNESLEIEKTLGNQRGIAGTLHQLGMLAQGEGELVEARRLSNESLEISRKIGNQNDIASTLHQLAMLAQGQDDLAEARRLYDESLEIKKKMGNQSGIALTLHNLGTLAEVEDNKSEAEWLYREALSIFERLGSPGAELARKSLARVKGESS